MRRPLCAFAAVVAVVLVGCRPQTSTTSPAPAPKAPARNPMPAGALARAFVDQLAKGNYAAAVSAFDETWVRKMPVAKLKQAWEAVVASAGAFQQQTGLQEAAEDPYNVVYVTCRFARTSLDVKLYYNTQQRISRLEFALAGSGTPYTLPPYAKPDSFNETDVVVGQGEWAVPGTLTMPQGAGPFPAILLVHSTGPQDRDETIGPSKPFRDLAWGLASRGIAVLRYAKHLKAYPKEMAAAVARLTVKEETVGDAVSAAALLRKEEGVDARRVFVLGYSLGGTLIPRIARGTPGAAGYVILAGTNRPLEDVMVEQLEYIASLGGPGADDARQRLPQVRAEAQRVKDPKLSPESPALLGAPAAYWLDLRAHDPLKAVAQVKAPILVLQGGRDYQATTVDFERWQKALAGRSDVTCKLYPDLNHLFGEGKGKAVPVEYEQPQHVSAQVIADLAGWIARQPPRRGEGNPALRGR